MKRLDLAQQMIDIQTMLEFAKDNLLEEKNEDALKLLHRASREMKVIMWKLTPVPGE